MNSNPRCAKPSCGHYLDEHGEGQGPCNHVFDDPDRLPICSCSGFAVADAQGEALRRSGIADATRAYTQGLKILGVTTTCIGISIDDRPGGAGYYQAAGNQAVILNLLCGLLSQLPPSDFGGLLRAMAFDPFFALARGESQEPLPSSKVN